jgi:hypothetical protein
MADRNLVRLAVTLLVIGAVVFQVAAFPEPVLAMTTTPRLP